MTVLLELLPVFWGELVELEIKAKPTCQACSLCMELSILPPSFLFAVQGLELEASYVSGTCSTTKLHLSFHSCFCDMNELVMRAGRSWGWRAGV